MPKNFVQIGGHRFEIIVTDKELLNDDKESIWGQYRSTDGKILISKRAGAHMGETLIHELMHAVDCIYNDNSLDEAAVDALAQGWYQILQQKDAWKVKE